MRGENVVACLEHCPPESGPGHRLPSANALDRVKIFEHYMTTRRHDSRLAAIVQHGAQKQKKYLG